MHLLWILAAAATASSFARAASLERRQGTTITVDLARTFQTIDGFGFCEAFQRANQLYALSPENRQYALDLLFNTTSGAGMSILRNGIGSSVDSRNDWMNTIAPRNPGGPNAPPQYVWDRNDSSQLWLSQRALEYGVRTIYANAWSAPGYMKTNGNDANGGTLCGVPGASCASGDWRQAYANYLVQYIRFYAQEGVPISHLGFINEPGLTTSYASMRFTGAQAADFTRILYQSLQAANLSTTIGINCCEAEGWNLAGSMTNDLVRGGVDNMINTITSHAYTNPPGGPINTRHHVWQTEWADLQGAWTSAWYQNNGPGEGMTWATRIHSALTQSNVSAFFYWVGIQGGPTNSKLIRIDGNRVDASKRLWAFGQFSRFVRPGAVRVNAQGGGGMRISAFRNADGTVAVQVINSGNAQSVDITLRGITPTEVRAYLTDNTHNLDETSAQVSGGRVTGNVPARAVVTLVITGTA